MPARKPSAKATNPAAKTRPAAGEGASASRLIDQRIQDLGDWRGETLARMRALILAAEPAAIEEWKWRGVPVWSHNGILCTGETYKQVVKLTFANGASLADPKRLFNASLDGNLRRAIDIPEGGDGRRRRVHGAGEGSIRAQHGGEEAIGDGPRFSDSAAGIADRPAAAGRSRAGLWQDSAIVTVAWKLLVDWSLNATRGNPCRLAMSGHRAASSNGWAATRGPAPVRASRSPTSR